MLERHDPSRVLCGHCGRERSSSACRGCGRQVCAACAADIASCPRPRSFAVRLGLGARLRLIARGAALGAVSTLTRRMWLLDITGRARLADPAWSYRWSRPMSDLGELSERGELVWPRVYSRQYTGALRVSSVAVGDRAYHLIPSVTRLRFDRSGSSLVGPTVDELVLIQRVEGGAPVLVAPLSRRVIQAFDADLDSGLVAATTHGELGAYLIEHQRQLSPTELDAGDCRWVGVMGQRIAAAIDSSLWLDRHALRIFELDGRKLEPVYTAHHRGSASLQDPPIADISDDGRFVALALATREIAVHDIDEGGVQRLGGHTDSISALRFGPGAGFLVSGDFDNRVIVRFREGNRFVQDLEALELDERK